jgi:microsomal dipeptidase-like Zn-dependent dipeptidase
MKMILSPMISDGRIGVLLHLTGNNHTMVPGTIDEFYRRGVRAIHPAMQYHSKTCGGIGGVEAPAALTKLGIACVRRMGELGMLVDEGEGGKFIPMRHVYAVSSYPYK